MGSFTESNTVKAYLYGPLSGPAKSVPAHVAQESQATHGCGHNGPSTPLRAGVGWRRTASADFPRQHQRMCWSSHGCARR